MNNLEGKTALVTGAGSKVGMGRAIALRLAREGADVAVSDISSLGIHKNVFGSGTDWHGLNDVAAEIKALGRKSLAVEADISNKSQVRDMLSQCLKYFGKLDILVNNAGMAGPKGMPLFEVNDDDFRRVVDVNLFGTYWCCQAVGRYMIEKGIKGKIINLASEGARGQVMPGHGPYIISKCGIVGLTQVVAVELARYKINVNAVCPGLTATEFVEIPSSENATKQNLPEVVARVYANAISHIPLGRIGQPEDVANVVTFLASSDSDYMTGQSINVTGGQNLS